ncbi:MAG: SUMF1/EgtB/PvdO family nonheme iron enzyme [Parvularculaceae bacterium]|nr:SUMF1/EgtB/PvdO family nonheme iron enzyme [Parvularculaceae bacterium]
MPDVFISYNREDRDTARLVAGALEAEGLSVWWDAALRAGETYDEVTEQNLRGAGAVVVLWSKRSVNSKWVRAEATVGERSSSLVPVLIEECERPIRFELVQTADLQHWRGDRSDPHWRAFMQDVAIAISRRGGKGAQTRPASAGVDASMETTFWNSIKDGGDRSDFDAYLKRYPDGHFAALARNRIAALSRTAPAAQARKPAAPQQRAPQQQARAGGAPQQRQAPRHAAPVQRQPEKKSSAGMLIGAVFLLIAGGAAGAFFIMRGGSAKEAAPGAQTAQVDKGDARPETQTDTPADAYTDDLTGDQSPAVEASTLAQAESIGEADALAAPDGDAAPLAPESEIALTSDGADALASDGADALTSEGADALALAGAQPGADAPAPAQSGGAPTPFQDCPSCPSMMPLAGGAFMMGSPRDETGRNAYEGPQHEVTVKPFAIGVYEVTNAQWRACVDASACEAKRDGDDRAPVLGVSWREASDYVRWLSRQTGRAYRIPTEAEWEYAARGGSTSAYWWGDRFEASRVATREPKVVGSFGANGFGLYDVLGNAREWVADCYVNNYAKAPADGSAVTDGDCSMRVVRGGAYSSPPVDMRVANRVRNAIGVGARYMGFRVAADAP